MNFLGGWLVEREIEPHTPVWEQGKVAPEGKLKRADFVYDDEKDHKKETSDAL